MSVVERLATEADAAEIAALVNRAYRPTAALRGWTHEAELVAGERASEEMVRALFGPGAAVLVLCREGRIVACVHVQDGDSGAYIGMLATEPAVQDCGLGKRMLAAAETYATTHFGVRLFRMTVLAARPELLAFYARRGYARSGAFEDFPLTAGCGQPRVDDLRLETLIKVAATA